MINRNFTKLLQKTILNQYAQIPRNMPLRNFSSFNKNQENQYQYYSEPNLKQLLGEDTVQIYQQYERDISNKRAIDLNKEKDMQDSLSRQSELQPRQSDSQPKQSDFQTKQSDFKPIQLDPFQTQEELTSIKLENPSKSENKLKQSDFKPIQLDPFQTQEDFTSRKVENLSKSENKLKQSDYKPKQSDSFERQAEFTSRTVENPSKSESKFNKIWRGVSKIIAKQKELKEQLEVKFEDSKKRWP